MKNSFPAYSAGTSAILAGMLYGSWAIFANIDHGLSSALAAGLVQAGYAGISTGIVTAAARRTLGYFGCHSAGALPAFLLTFMIMFSMPLMIHALARTPDLLQTILPGVILGSGYIVLVIKAEISNTTGLES